MSLGIDFTSSRAATVGVEIELQIIDPETGDLAPGATRILDACAAEGIPGVAGEFLLSMIEVKTDVCRDIRDVRDNLFPRLRQVRNVALSLGYDLAIGGSHPFARPSMCAIAPDPRYQAIMKRQGWMAYQEAVFGLHVHVGAPDGDSAIGVLNQAVEYIPHFLALSANSPYWQGVDTDYVSARSRMFRPTASCGLPPCLENWKAFCEYSDAMREAQLIEGVKDMYWDVRPQPKFGTIEFRIFDVPAAMTTVLGLAALTRCFVVDRLQKITQNKSVGQPDEHVYWFAAENRWLASRYGLDTCCIRRRGESRRTIAEDLNLLIDELLPVAEQLGESKFLQSIRPDAMGETGASRQRRVFRQAGGWHGVIADMRQRWVHELDEIATECDNTRTSQENKRADLRIMRHPGVSHRGARAAQ